MNLLNENKLLISINMGQIAFDEYSKHETNVSFSKYLEDKFSQMSLFELLNFEVDIFTRSNKHDIKKSLYYIANGVDEYDMEDLRFSNINMSKEEDKADQIDPALRDIYRESRNSSFEAVSFYDECLKYGKDIKQTEMKRLRIAYLYIIISSKWVCQLIENFQFEDKYNEAEELAKSISKLIPEGNNLKEFKDKIAEYFANNIDAIIFMRNTTLKVDKSIVASILYNTFYGTEEKETDKILLPNENLSSKYRKIAGNFIADDLVGTNIKNGSKDIPAQFIKEIIKPYKIFEEYYNSDRTQSFDEYVEKKVKAMSDTEFGLLLNDVFDYPDKVVKDGGLKTLPLINEMQKHTLSRNVVVRLPKKISLPEYDKLSPKYKDLIDSIDDTTVNNQNFLSLAINEYDDKTINLVKLSVRFSNILYDRLAQVYVNKSLNEIDDSGTDDDISNLLRSCCDALGADSSFLDNLDSSLDEILESSHKPIIAASYAIYLEYAKKSKDNDYLSYLLSHFNSNDIQSVLKKDTEARNKAKKYCNDIYEKSNKVNYENMPNEAQLEKILGKMSTTKNNIKLSDYHKKYIEYCFSNLSLMKTAYLESLKDINGFDESKKITIIGHLYNIAVYASQINILYKNASKPLSNKISSLEKKAIKKYKQNSSSDKGNLKKFKEFLRVKIKECDKIELFAAIDFSHDTESLAARNMVLHFSLLELKKNPSKMLKELSEKLVDYENKTLNESTQTKIILDGFTNMGNSSMMSLLSDLEHELNR